MNDPLAPIPDWVVDLAAAVSRLSGEQIAVLASGYGRDRPALAPSAIQLQRNLSLLTTDATHLARSLKRIVATPGVTGHDVGVALATLAHTRFMAAARDERVEVVCTAPSRLGAPVRTTFATAVEMVQAARQEIFVVGYVFTGGARKLVEQFAVACRDRKVRVTLIGNRMQEQLFILQSLWPPDSPPPSVFSREADLTDDMAALHAKLLICDGTTALVTSANFSHHGLHENIEIGVKIHSASVARLVDFVHAMVRTGEVKGVEWPSSRKQA
jgi:phosphatidylserine/phosphatidylglycerophosphate/cardiolipin synthase-like enzyme